MMSLGNQIRHFRVKRKMTQEELAEKMNVPFQAVSAWERDAYLPDTGHLIRLAEILGVSVSSLTEEQDVQMKPAKAVFDWEHMKTFVKTTAKSHGMTNTLKALDFAVNAHAGQKRRKSDIPYIYHPLNLACHALAMGFCEDEIIAACLLHDVIEDCGCTAEDLPVSEEIREITVLLTRPHTTKETREAVTEEYYAAVAGNIKACLIKCLDRCNNLTTMAWGMSRERMVRYVIETEKYYPALLKILKADPAYNNAAWLLRYQIDSMLDIYKSLLY